MSVEKCNLCGMIVQDLVVHFKFNHKKNKKSKLQGFGYQGFTPGRSPSTASPRIPSISKYQESQKKSQLSTPKHKSDDRKEVKSVRAEETLSESLQILEKFVDKETARSIYNLEGVTDAELGNIFKSGSISQQKFEVQLMLMGIVRMGNTYKKVDKKQQRTCPDCGEGFEWNKSKRGRKDGFSVAYHEHIKTCGIGSIYDKTDNKAQETVDKYWKEEIEIKEETDKNYGKFITPKTELVNDKENYLEARNIVKTEFHDNLLNSVEQLKQVKKEPVETSENVAGPFTIRHGDYDQDVQADIKNIVKKEAETNMEELNLEAYYGKNLMLKKLNLKRQPEDTVKSLEEFQAKIFKNKSGSSTSRKDQLLLDAGDLLLQSNAFESFNKKEAGNNLNVSYAELKLNKDLVETVTNASTKKRKEYTEIDDNETLTLELTLVDAAKLLNRVNVIELSSTQSNSDESVETEGSKDEDC